MIQEDLMAALNAGVPAPKFKLPDMKGGQFSLEDALKHGPVLLAFFKISCPTCQFTFPYLERLFRSLKGKAVPAIVGISQNNQEDTKSFLRQFGVTFPILLDNSKEYPVSSAYGITNVPTLFYVDHDGTIEVSSVGWSRKDLEQIAQRIEQSSKVANIAFFQTGEEIPESKAG
jgi:peroxiredoxin